MKNIHILIKSFIDIMKIPQHFTEITLQIKNSQKSRMNSVDLSAKLNEGKRKKGDDPVSWWPDQQAVQQKEQGDQPAEGRPW